MDPRRLTDAELREPDVVIECTADEFYQLPARAQELIRVYGEERVSNGRSYISVAAYRWRDEIAPLVLRPAPDAMEVQK